MAHNEKLEKGPNEAEMSLLCAHKKVLVIVYKNDPPPTLQNISLTQKAVHLAKLFLIKFCLWEVWNWGHNEIKVQNVGVSCWVGGWLAWTVHVCISWPRFDYVTALCNLILPQFHIIELLLLFLLLLDFVLRLVWQGIRSFLSHRNIFMVRLPNLRIWYGVNTHIPWTPVPTSIFFTTSFAVCLVLH